MTEYKCVNDFWIICTDNERWDKEHAEVAKRETQNVDCNVFYKCILDKNTCGFNKSLQNKIIETQTVSNKTTSGFKNEVTLPVKTKSVLNNTNNNLITQNLEISTARMKLYLAMGQPTDDLIRIFQECNVENVLLSYAYIRGLKNGEYKMPFKNIMLDSGAFSVATIGEKISLKAYILWLQIYLSQNPQIKTYINLDDLDDPQKSIENYKIMKSEGLDPMPVYHFAEPDKVLDYYAEQHDYIGLGGLAVGTIPSENLRLFWERVHQRHPQHKFHILGVGTMTPFYKVQPYSLDSTSWNVGSIYGHLMCYKKGLPYRMTDLNKTNGIELFFTPEEMLKNNIRAQISWGKGDWLQNISQESKENKQQRML
jgi:hypothetical protein